MTHSFIRDRSTAVPDRHSLPDGVFVIDDLLSPDECLHWIETAEAAGFETAPISTVGGTQVVTDVRNNGRVMFDDQPLAESLWPRLEPHVPSRMPTIWRGHWWQAHGLNERFRSYRYEPGQYFDWHQDGSFRRNNWERSLLSVIFYLNDDFEGGYTEFGDGTAEGESGTRIAPRRGRALVFLHPLLHQGAAVTSGSKYVLRTDVMYRKV